MLPTFSHKIDRWAIRMRNPHVPSFLPRVSVANLQRLDLTNLFLSFLLPEASTQVELQDASSIWPYGCCKRKSILCQVLGRVLLNFCFNTLLSALASLTFLLTTTTLFHYLLKVNDSFQGISKREIQHAFLVVAIYNEHQLVV